MIEVLNMSDQVVRNLLIERYYELLNKARHRGLEFYEIPLSDLQKLQIPVFKRVVSSLEDIVSASNC